MINWLRENFGTLTLSFLLAIAAWVAAISTRDPIQEQAYPEPLPIQYRGLQENLLLTGDVPEQAEAVLRAPLSVWEALVPSDIQVVADLEGLGAGRHRIALKVLLQRRAVQVTALDPATIEITLEPLESKTVGLRLEIIGEPAPDYEAEEPALDLQEVTVSGPKSLVDRVDAAEIHLDLTNRQRPIDQELQIIPVDFEGQPVEGLTLSAESVRVSLQITKRENIRRLVVVPIIEGREELEAEGWYRLVRIVHDPPEVAVFSEDPEALEALPGYVQTLPIDVSNVTETIERWVPLDLPQGFSLIGVQSIKVTVEIEPIMTTTAISRPVEVEGLGYGLYAYPSPEQVGLILSGPAAVLDTLTPEQVHVVVDVSTLPVGTHVLEPQILDVPESVTYDAPTPATIEVVLTFVERPTSTPTPSP